MYRAILSAGVILMMLTTCALAKDMKLAYVDSERILQTFEDYRNALQKLQEEERQFATQATAMEDVVKQMIEELRSQSLMLSDDARRDRESKLRSKQEELDRFRRETWGEGGKLFTRNIELSKPVLEKINTAIQKVAQENSYDFVFDAASANIVYALPEHDITDKVLELLQKE